MRIHPKLAQTMPASFQMLHASRVCSNSNRRNWCLKCPRGNLITSLMNQLRLCQPVNSLIYRINETQSLWRPSLFKAVVIMEKRQRKYKRKLNRWLSAASLNPRQHLPRPHHQSKPRISQLRSKWQTRISHVITTARFCGKVGATTVINKRQAWRSRSQPSMKASI